MREKLKSLDRNIISLVVIALLVVVGVVYANTNSSDSGEEANATSQEDKSKAESASEQKPSEDQKNSEESGVSEKPADAEEAPADSKPNESEADAADEDSPYSYSAQAGDSYTKIVRKAVQTYGINNDINLTPAQIIYAETVLTQAAGEPALEIGQKVNIDESTLKSTIDKATELDDAAEAQWDYYVQFVDFNTDAVGEVRE